MSHFVVFILSLFAFGELALAMDRHQKSVFGGRLAITATRGLRLGGWAALALALWAAVRAEGWTLGLVSYSGHTSLAAGLVFGGLVAIERRKVPLRPEKGRRGQAVES